MEARPRERLITSAIEMVRERGVHAAGLAELLERSSASRNSLYQHFPAGKSELIETATRTAGAHVAAIIDTRTATRTPQALLAAWFDWWRTNLASSSFAAGCPILAAALAEAEPRVQAAAGEAFADWTDRLAAGLSAAGMAPQRAASFGSFVISAIEGAVAQARATKTVRPIDDAHEHLQVLLTAYLGDEHS